MTISPAVLDAMVAAGCTAEQIAAVVKADMAANDDKRADKRAKDAERQRRHRARNAESQPVTRDTCDTLPPSPAPLSSPPTPPPIIPQTPSTIPETKRASRLSPDWALPAAWGRWAMEQGCSEAHVRNEAAKFRDYWVSKSGRDAAKLDWEATWRNWIRNSGRGLGSQGPPTERRESITDVLKRQVLEMQNGCEAEESDGVGEADGFGSPVLRLASPPR